MKRLAVPLVVLALVAVFLFAVLPSREASPPAAPEDEAPGAETPAPPPAGEPGPAVPGEAGIPEREFPDRAIRGFVLREEDGSPVEGARVQLFSYGGAVVRQVPTDGGGFFEFADTSAGVFGLMIVKEQVGSLRVEPVRPGANAPEYRLAAGGTLHGRVVTAPDEAPLPSYRILAARVLFTGDEKFDQHRVIHHQMLPEEFATDGLAIADPQGGFRFTALQPGTYVLLVFPGDGRAPAFENGGGEWYDTRAGFEVKGGEETGPVEIVLAVPGRIRVRVVDAVTGAPLTGVSFSSNLRIDRRHVTAEAEFPRPAADGEYELPVALDESGQVRSAHFTLEKADYGTVPLSISGQMDGALVELVMGPAARIRGTVLGPEGRPVAGANVIVLEDGGEQVLAGVRTDSSGAYDSGPVAGQLALSVRVFDSDRGNLLGVAPVTLSYGEERVLDIGGGKTAAVFGKVLLGGGAVRGAFVRLDSGETQVWACTGDDGTWRIESLPAGDYEAFAVYSGTGGEAIFRTIPFALRELEQKRLDFVTDLTISGVVLLSEDGEIRSVTTDEFEIAARREGTEDRVSTRLLGEGRFVLHVDRPGVYELGFFDTTGFVERDPVRVDLTEVKSVTDVRVVALRDAMDGRITLRVTDAESGEQVPEGSYQYRHRWTSGAGWFEDGTITFEQEGLGTFRISVDSDRHVATPIEVEITTARKLIEREVALLPSNAVRIRELTAGSAAGNAGIRAGDVILRYGGEPTCHREELKNAIGRTMEDQVVEVELLRDGRPLTISVPGGRMGVYIENHRVE